MYILSHEIVFPPTHLADEDGLLCVGGDLSTERLLLAYSKGIFPWYNEYEPIQWYAPDPRFVLFPDKLKVSKSMKQVIRKNEFHLTFNQDFERVIRNCKTQIRKGQSGTWIDYEMELAYMKLHQLGHAYSFECRHGDKLVGGLYGVLHDKVFCGESMFSLESNASKLAFIKAVEYLSNDGIELIDCQIYTPHLESMGAELIDRKVFESYLLDD